MSAAPPEAAPNKPINMDASALKVLMSKAAKLLSLAETQNTRTLKDVLANWPGAERRGNFLLVPLRSVLGGFGGDGTIVRVPIASTVAVSDGDASSDGDVSSDTFGKNKGTRSYSEKVKLQVQAQNLFGSL